MPQCMSAVARRPCAPCTLSSDRAAIHAAWQGTACILVSLSCICGNSEQSNVHVVTGTESNPCPVCTAQEQFQDAKVTVFKKRRRKNSRRKMGHRQACASPRVPCLLACCGIHNNAAGTLEHLNLVRLELGTVVCSVLSLFFILVSQISACLVQELTSLRIVLIHGLEAPEAEAQPALAAAA